MARRNKRKNVLDWWQTVLDETKDLIDDGIDRIRDDDDDDDERLQKEVADLKRSIVDLSAKLDALVAAKATTAAKTAP
jgi:gas vesicle protein